MNRRSGPPLLLTFVLLTLVSLAPWTSAHAQLRTDAFGAMGGFVPMTPIDQPFAGGDPAGGDVGYHTTEIWGGLPPVDLAGGTLLSGVSWERIAFRYERPGEITSPRNLHQVAVTGIWLRPAGDGRMIMLFATPSLNSDFEDGLQADDLFLSGAAALRWQLTDNTNLGAGVYATWVFGDLAVLPMVDLMYGNGRVQAEVAFPRSTVLYRVTTRVEAGFTAFLDGGQYNFGDYRSPTGRVDHVNLSSLSAGPVLNVEIGRSWLLNLQAGFVSGQKYELYDSDEVLLPGGDASLESAWFLRSGITWRFRPPE